MQKFESSKLSRRRLLEIAGFSAGAALFNRQLFSGTKEGIVPTMVNSAAKAKINVSAVRRNISVLEGSGGNIAVLTGRDGKLLIEAGFAVSRPAISKALLSINNDPIQHLINTHWHTDHTDGNAWLHSRVLRSRRTRTRRNAFWLTHGLRVGTGPFRLCPPAHYQPKCSEPSTK